MGVYSAGIYREQTVTTVNDDNLLLQAVEDKDVERVEALLRSGHLVNIVDTKGDSLLYKALAWKNEAIARLLLEHGANVNIRSSHENHCETALQFSVWLHSEGVTKLLLDGGADPNAADELGRTPLLEAAEQAQENLVQLLLERGAKPNTADHNGKTPIYYAARRCVEGVRLLLAAGADPNICDKEDKKSPLHVAAYEGREDIVQLLLEAGADPFAANSLNMLPSNYAAAQQKPAVITAIIQYCKKFTGSMKIEDRDVFQLERLAAIATLQHGIQYSTEPYLPPNLKNLIGKMRLIMFPGLFA